MAKTERGAQGRGHLPGLLLHMGVAMQGGGRGKARPQMSWRTASWDALTLADLTQCALSPATPALLARWQAVHAQKAGASGTPPWPHAWQGAPHRVLMLDEPGLSWAARRRFKRVVQAAYPGSAVTCLPRDVDPTPWFAKAHVVCTHSAAPGMLALLAGAKVHTWGMPFYAGWGLTQDERPVPSQRGKATLRALFEAVAVQRSAYADLAREGQGSLATVLDFMALQAEVHARFAKLGSIEARGLARWKRPFVAPFLQAGGQAMRWQPRLGAAPSQAHSVALWGATARPLELGKAQAVVRVEDGFLRSAGLGSDLVPPRSLVVDSQGIYFDARGGSDLIHALNHDEVDATARERALALQVQLVDTGITKYNFVRRPPEWAPPPRKRVVLVAGQVADDASIALGSGSQPHHVRGAEQLLKAVRERCPHDFVVYKPHPDVLSGNRQGLIHAQSWCDLVDTQSDLLSLVEVSDEVHVISSLAGLDALIRNKKVVTHGMPFYAGWGLTTDLCEELPPRLRSRDLAELLALCLLSYPIYWDWEWGVFSTAEASIRQLCLDREHAVLPGEGQRTSRALHKTKKWLRNMLSE
jgi:capsular polysaccharide export protein